MRRSTGNKTIVVVLCVLNFRNVRGQGSGKGNQTRVGETPDGCPFSFDFGQFAYKYKLPGICESLLPDHLKEVSLQHNPVPFRVGLEQVESDDSFYHISITVEPGFNDTKIAGAILRTEKIKANGKVTLDVHAGHLEIDSPEASGYCCSNSKYHSLIHIFQRDPKLQPKMVKVRWYPMNFGVGRIMLDANVFADEKRYWKIRDLEFKIPIVRPTTPATLQD